jgi:hypothetical protein
VNHQVAAAAVMTTAAAAAMSLVCMVPSQEWRAESRRQASPRRRADSPRRSYAQRGNPCRRACHGRANYSSAKELFLRRSIFTVDSEPMRAIIFVLCLFFSAWAQAAEPGNLPKSRNIAYEDGFAWYVAGRLAQELSAFQTKLDVNLSDSEVADFRNQYSIIYHNFIVACDGPLPEIAEALKFFDLNAQDTGTQVLSYVGQMEHSIWPIVQKWNSRILLVLLDEFKKGTYGFFPVCIVDGYKVQNPISGVTRP